MESKLSNKPQTYESYEAFDKDLSLEKISKYFPGATYQFLMAPDGKSRIPYATDGIWEIFEVTPKEVKKDSSKAFNRIHPDDYSRIIESISKSFKTLEVWKTEFRVNLPQKGTSWIRGLAKPEKLSDGSVLWHGYLREINELKDAKEEIEKFFEINLDLLCITDLDGNFIRLSKAWEDLLGYSVESLESKHILDYVHPKDIKKTKTATQEVLKQKDAKGFVNRYKTKQGDYKYLEWHGRRHGSFVYAAARDITARIDAEAKAKHMSDLLKYIIEHNRSAVAVHDLDLKYLYVSNKYLETFKVQDKNIIGKHHYEVFPDLPQKWRDFHQRALQGEISSSGEDPYYRADGTMDWTRWECRPWYHKNGAVGGIIVYTEVITDQKLMEEMVYNEKEQFKTTLLSVGDGVISTGTDCKVRMMNPIAEKLTGWRLLEAKGKPLQEIFKIINEHTGKQCINPAEEVLRTGEVIEMEDHTLLVSKNGKEIPIQDSAAPIKDKSGHVTGVVIVFKDFTEKREREKQIEYLSFNDFLTGLYNRRYMEDSIRRLDTPRSLPFSLIRLDVNGLKLTNDAFGHQMGDRLLQTVANILKKSCRSEEIICRTGGDEFDILLPNTDEKEVKVIIDRITQKASMTRIESVMVSIAIGYATKKYESQNIYEILKEADNAMYKNKLQYGRIMRSKTIETVLVNINNKYDKEQLHTEMVSHYCEAIAKALQLNEREVSEIKTAGILHDIGKIMVPPELLNKSEPLTSEEWEIIKRHPVTSYQILRGVDEYASLSEYVLYHHERWDGKGYPEGLKGESIPLQARIICVADAYEAMTAQRAYHTPKTKVEALHELEKCAGSQFDPEIVTMFIKTMQ